MNDKVEALSEGLTDTVQDLLREAKPLLTHATDCVTDRASHMIRHEPFKAMLVAAGIGAATVLLAGLMTRSNAAHRAH